MGASVTDEIKYLVTAIHRLGEKNAAGQVVVPYGKLVHDDQIANTLEGLFGTLKAAKKRKVVAFQGELLLSPVHDKVEVILLTDIVPDA
ncbi:hypothetical protein AMAG_05907 [Allomyces macrogynus ATCC 38327]|uniref:Costars domain-containing protein n=1 Tax=Allomyces macrogynus (strain ATCC 38327) TaxID=578462 RepID=A0A0L0SDG9_ALLM3|nr:hypothetical protein AMAG_05907 [Allomyces macrogynus ATCC 38327]|eukprot:KNE60526.1 hypothetical protein AMAG_05907 [Allomyces macrogynus ATCC 38327]